MTSMAMASIGCTAPYFTGRGVKINGEEYKRHLENNLFPAITSIAISAGKGDAFSFQQDGATAHGVADVLKSIKKNTAKPFPFKWPSRSPDLNPCDFFLWGRMQGILDDMDGALKTEPQLRAAVHLVHGQVSTAEMAKAVDQVYKRCEKVIEVSGARFEFKM